MLQETIERTNRWTVSDLNTAIIIRVGKNPSIRCIREREHVGATTKWCHQMTVIILHLMICKYIMYTATWAKSKSSDTAPYCIKNGAWEKCWFIITFDSKLELMTKTLAKYLTLAPRLLVAVGELCGRLSSLEVGAVFQLRPRSFSILSLNLSIFCPQASCYRDQVYSGSQVAQ